MNLELDYLQHAIENQLEKIEKVLGPNYKLTLIATHNGANDLKDADILLTMADRKSIMRAVDRFLPVKDESDDLIAQRDFWEERATKLATAVGKHFGLDFGEHSSCNDPTLEALKFIG